MAYSFIRFLITSVVATTISFGASAQGLGITWGGDLVLFDPVGGQGGAVSNSGLQHCQGMARTADGRVIIVNTSSSVRFWEIDAQTFQVTQLGSPGFNDVRAIAADPFDPDLLYAIDRLPASNFGALYAVDLTSMQKTLIGTTPFKSIQGMTFVPQGPLYAWDVSIGLVELDETTGAGFDVNAVLDGHAEIQSLAWSNGSLYGVRESLFRFDLLTGSPVMQCDGPFGDIRGAELFDGLCGQYNYCDTSPNSVGPGVLISSLGSLSITGNDFTLRASGGVPREFGLFFFGFEPADVPFGNGRLCVGGALHRANPLRFDLAGEGSYSLDFSAPPPIGAGGMITPGVTVDFQLWYRDPGVGVDSNTSDGLAVIFCP